MPENIASQQASIAAVVFTANNDMKPSSYQPKASNEDEVVLPKGDSVRIALPMGSSSSAEPTEATKNSPIHHVKAVESLLCAMISLFPFVAGIVLGPMAIALAVGAQKEMHAEPGKFSKCSKCMAKTGLILGFVGMVISIVVLIVWFPDSGYSTPFQAPP